MTDDLRRAFRDFELDGWQQVAKGYSEITEATNAALTAGVLDAAAVGPGMRVLDVASGPGWVTAGAAARAADAIGVDFAEAMVLL